jgi:hypothetical protein
LEANDGIQRLRRWIHFLEVLSHDDPAGEVRPGDAVARIAKSEQVVREVPVGADAGQSVCAERVVGGPAVVRLDAGDIRIQRRQLVHQLTGALDNRLVAQPGRRRIAVRTAHQKTILADPANRVRWNGTGRAPPIRGGRAPGESSRHRCGLREIRGAKPEVRASDL